MSVNQNFRTGLFSAKYEKMCLFCILMPMQRIIIMTKQNDIIKLPDSKVNVENGNWKLAP